MSSDREERDDDGWVEGVSDQKGINSIPLVTLIYGRTNKNTHNPCMEILTQREDHCPSTPEANAAFVIL